MQASLETPEGSLAKDIVLAVQLSRPKTGLDLITSNPRGEDGYFQLTMTAGEDLATFDTGMDFVFVLDVSGSMANDGKMVISRDAITSFIDELGAKDRFEVLSFNVLPQPLFNSLRDTGVESRKAALAFLDSREGRGGTVLKPALDTALRYADPDRPLNIVILSDGMTEQQERAALLQASSRHGGGVRIFCIGVGNEVNRPLLEQLAQESGGLAAFISQGDDFARQAKAFRRKLTRPVMDNIRLDFGKLAVYDMVPQRLPNLYHGNPVRVYGRYKGEGEAGIVIKGTVQGREISQTATLAFGGKDNNPDNPEIERMWAWRRVDELQKQADREGDRAGVIGEIIRLGESYSIVTEYTSFLVLENDAEYQRWKIERRNEDRTTRDRSSQDRTRNRLAAIRDKAVATIGPAAAGAEAPAAQPGGAPAGAKPAIDPTPAAAVPRPRSPGNGIDFSPGTGPVGPLFLLLSGWMVRRARKGTR